MLERIRLVATDMDGTLLGPGGQVSARTAAAVAAARAAGIHVVPITGRPPQALWELAAAAGVGPLGVCANGSALVDLQRGVVIEVEEIAADVGAGLVDLVRRAVPEVRMATDSLECFSYERGFFAQPVDWQEKLEEVDDILPVVHQGCIKLIARVPGYTAAQLIERLSTDLGELAHVTTSGLDWVDIGAAGISKAYAMDRVCELLGVSVADVVAIGDNHNDLSVLAWAGFSMAPANAIPEVLASVERILPSNADDGVAYLLEELVAGRLVG